MSEAVKWELAEAMTEHADRQVEMDAEGWGEDPHDYDGDYPHDVWEIYDGLDETGDHAALPDSYRRLNGVMRDVQALPTQGRRGADR